MNIMAVDQLISVEVGKVIVWPKCHSMKPVASGQLSYLFKCHALLHGLACRAMKYLFSEPAPNSMIYFVIRVVNYPFH